MRISLNWINELVDIKYVNFSQLIEKLTLGGFEVENTFEILIGQEKDTILEISATANRSDSLSTRGIAAEIVTLLNKVHIFNIYETEFFDPIITLQNCFSNSEILDEQNCSIFLTITAENIENITSPKWLKQKLISSGLEPSNTLSDFQNFILLETGYPVEFYDLEKIKKKLNVLELKLTTINSDSLISNLNNINSQLTDDILILKNNYSILSIAGIVSNKQFRCDEKTKSILIEASIFNSKKIRKISRNLGIRTDRSARYEKGLSKFYFNETICRLLNLLRINNLNIIYKVNSIAQTPYKPIQSISLNHKNIVKILGPTKSIQNQHLLNLTPEQISFYLNQLNFNFEFDSNIVKWEVKVPDSRVQDIDREIDLIEEIGRLHGFNNFNSCLPEIKNIGTRDFSYQIRKKLMTCFLSEGLNELVQYSLVKPEEISDNSIKLINPLISDYSMLRTSLIPSILETIRDNLKQGNRNIEGFEFGRIFTKNSNKEYYEREYVAGNLGNVITKLTWSENVSSLSWFEAKGKLENIFKKLNISIYWKKSTFQPYKNFIHPYRMAQCHLLNGNLIGIFGQINPIIAKRLNISNKIYLFELDFEILKYELSHNLLPLYKEYSPYPKIIKDLSFNIKKDVSFQEIKQLVLERSPKILYQLSLLDKYEGESIPMNYKSLCIQLIFQSTKKTLRSNEVETIIQNIKSILLENYDIIFK